MRKQTKIVVAVVAALAVVGVGAFEVLTSAKPDPCAGTTVPSSPAPANAPTAAAPLRAEPAAARSAAVPAPPPAFAHPEQEGQVIPVVAAENFWGSLVSQLGGNLTSVLSIVTDPNADPHEYEANASDATAIAHAEFVIVNGVGYDDWAIQLVASAANPNQLLLNAGALNGVSVTGGIVTGNPHLWYNPVYVNRTVAAMYSDLVTIEPGAARTFQTNYAALNVSLGELYARANEIRSEFAGTVVASTESIFVYLANYTGLDLVSPPEFMEAIAEGNDPPAQSVVTFQCQLESGKVHLLVYNEQTVTPITTNMKSIAASENVTLIGVTETIQPPGVSFQTWMFAEYLELQNALNADELGR